MNSEQRNQLEAIVAKKKEITDELSVIAERERDLIAAILEDPERGDQMEIIEITGLSRERVRQLGRTYYRTIVRYADGLALIKMPRDNVHESVVYELRGKEGVVLGRVTGQQLLAARREQLDAYLEEDATRTNIAMVDVSEFLD